LSAKNLLSKTRQNKRILVTAALPYANGPIHLGHLAGAYLPADIFVRYQRLRGRDVLFVCGSDEHGVAITIEAEKQGITPQALVDRYQELNKTAFERFGLSLDIYSRTSLPLHHATAQEFFLQFYKTGVLKEKKDQQLYCEVDKRFLADRYVEGKCPNCGYESARGDQCENCGTWLNQIDLVNPRCKSCGSTPVIRETTQFYFPLGQFQKRLEEYLNSRKGWKESVLNYCRGWFKEGLEDRAVTRDLHWGIAVPEGIPGGEGKVIYVWFEALLGYISASKEWAQRVGDANRWRRYWLNRDTRYIAFLGKDNIVFHSIVFPAMLMAWNDSSEAKYVLPDNVPANEFLNYEGQKFSKSRGWGIDALDFLAEFPADPLRYTLAMNLPEYRDTDFYWKDFQARNNNELADVLGNFVNRTLTFVQRYYQNKVPPRNQLTAVDKAFAREIKEAPEKIGKEYFEQFRFREGCQEIIALARSGNVYFDKSQPWRTVKDNPTQCETTLNLCLQAISALSTLCEPLIPATARKVRNMLNLAAASDGDSWAAAGQLKLEPGHLLGKAEILFTKIEDKVIEQKLPKDQTATPSPTSEKSEPAKPTITIEDFRKLDLRVAKVTKCERVPKSHKLLKLEVELGSEQRQVIAGIAHQYKPEDLVGKTIVVVANLEPAKLMGQESHGMLLAAQNESGELSIVTLDKGLHAGSVVK
jgi:methionyl-tRNA synthetase